MPLQTDDAGTMTVGVRQLRDHLSRYLDEVKAGRAVIITDHGTAIATIVPRQFSARTLELAAQGRVTLPTLPKGDPREWPTIEVDGGIQDILREVRGG